MHGLLDAHPRAVFATPDGGALVALRREITRAIWKEPGFFSHSDITGLVSMSRSRSVYEPITSIMDVLQWPVILLLHVKLILSGL